MELIQNYNQWLEKVGKIKLNNCNLRAYSLHDKSIRSQNGLFDDDGFAFIFVFSSEDVTPFILGLPLSVLQNPDEFLSFSEGELNLYKERVLLNFPSGNVWTNVEEEYVDKVEKFLSDIIHCLKNSTKALSEELKLNEELF